MNTQLALRHPRGPQKMPGQYQGKLWWNDGHFKPVPWPAQTHPSDSYVRLIRQTNPSDSFLHRCLNKTRSPIGKTKVPSPLASSLASAPTS